MRKDAFKELLLPPLNHFRREQPSKIGKIVVFCYCVFEERAFCCLWFFCCSEWLFLGRKGGQNRKESLKKEGRLGDKGRLGSKIYLKSSQKVYATS